MNRLSLDKRILLLSLLVEGTSLRAASRIVGCSINTVSKLLLDVGETCQVFHDETVRGLAPRRVELDELWSFCYAKQKTVNQAPVGPQGAGDLWTWTAIDADTKLAICWRAGDRGEQMGVAFLEDLRSRVSGSVMLATDGYQVYLSGIEEVFGDEALHLKRTEGASTSYVERQNLTMRQGMRRYTRKTTGFSKKMNYHLSMLALYFAHYNFVRTHSSIETTPAQAAGLAHDSYDMEWLAKISN